MTRIRTLDFLPEIFQTPTNRQFLSATLDQLVNPPVTQRIQGYVGSKFGYGINANDYYVTEPSKVRTNYQLDPGVVFTKENNTTAKDFISYPGLLDALKLAGGITNNADRLFNSQFYSWDSFTDLDKIINFNQYYWIPEGPPAVQVASATVFTSNDYVVTDLANGYNIRTAGAGAGSINPTITLLRGGTYNFYVNQTSQFWIQSEPGTSGTSAAQPNQTTRDIFGVSNNGASNGVITFTVPSKNAQDEFNFPGNNPVGVVSDKPFSLIQGQRVSSLTNGIDGVTSLNGLTVMFYNTGLPNEIGYTSQYYGEFGFDTNGNIVSPETINVTATSSTGNIITCSSTANLTVNQTITFSGVGFGGLSVYDAGVIPGVGAGSFTTGQKYYITLLGSTDWISAGVSSAASVTASITGTQLVVTSPVPNALNIGQTIAGTGVTAGTKIVGYDLTASLATGLDTYIVDISQTVSSTTIDAYNIFEGAEFTATSAGSGTGVATPFSPTIYYVTSIINGTQFTISTEIGGTDITLTNATGLLIANINQGLYEEGYYSTVADNFYTITYVGDPTDPVIRLVPAGEIPINEKIIPLYGTEYIEIPFYKNTAGTILKIPYISAPLDILYYQDSQSSNKVGIIKLIESNITNTLNVETDILGKKNFTSTNGVVFTNGLKVEFDGDVIPRSYLQGQYYVQGVGSAIELIPTENLLSPEPFTVSTSTPYDILPYDVGAYDSSLYVPETPDYITIARNAKNRNAWSRSNRWFHIDVINATAQYNDNPQIAIDFASNANKAKRPIIEFYPNLKLFNLGTEGKDAVDFIDYRSTDAFNQVAGTPRYYPDVEVYSSNTGTIYAPPVSPDPNAGKTTTIQIAASDVVGTLYEGLYISDSAGLLPSDAQVTSVSGTTTLTITVAWSDEISFATTTNISIVANETPNNNFVLFPNARIIFAADENEAVRNKIYVVSFSTVTYGDEPVITLTEAPDGDILINDQVFVLRGYNYQGQSFWYDGIDWIQGQQKLTVNQAPLFDVLDKNGISFSDNLVYTGTSFRGCTLFSYGVGDGVKDPVLGFPLRYSQIDNVGDISFDVTLNSDTFDYVSDRMPITENVNTGYVYNYSDRETYERLLGWQTAVGPSTQYQIFEFAYTANATPIVLTNNEYIEQAFVCDVALLDQDSSVWPVIQVYINNVLQNADNYTITTTSNSTTVLLKLFEDVSTKVEIILLSDQVSQRAYYSIPINLNNNPFNTDITVANVGDIRGQYQSIFDNCPDSQGTVFGSNNYRDLGNVVPYGTKIIQNSASLVLPAAFLRDPTNSLFDSILYNSREYVKFKQMLVDVVNNSDYNQRFNPAYMLDNALDQMTASKNQDQSFFWSDMIPSKAPLISNTYTFQNALETSIYPLTKVYDFSQANYNGVLVYLTTTIEGVTITKQLVRGIDYVVSTDSPSLTVNTDLNPGDQVTVSEYNQTYGSYIPNTPTKLGLYPAYLPQVILDTSYTNPTYFIQGHDGSYNKLYGEYNTDLGILIDFRDQVLLEFETRVYNNLKLSSTIPVQAYEILPGYFRNTDYSYEQWLQIYTPFFLDWVGVNRLDYKVQLYNSSNPYTWNYDNTGNKLNNDLISQGYWRGIYQYYFDTSTPNTTPWQMLGYVNQPDWWTERYGPAPYTNQNLILWQDLENGYDWNNGNPVILEQYARPGLLDILPIDEAGNLIQPLDSVIGNFNPNTFRKDWKVGDDAPVEFSYRKSSSYPFDLMRITALMKPAKFFNLGVDLDNYKYNAEFNQYLVNDRKHLIPSEIQIYGNGIAKTSYINWIVDYQKQIGKNGTDIISNLLFNLDVRLIYRLAGFSDKTLLKFFVEKGTPNSINSSLLIPDESYALMLYENQPIDKLIYSAVIVQSVPEGFRVYGNSQTNAYFGTLVPSFNGNYETINIESLSVKLPVDYTTIEQAVPYGQLFYNVNDLSIFLASYGKWLESRGAQFDTIENAIQVNWNTLIAEFLYWAQTGWEIGSLTTLNPFAKILKINKENQVVQPLTLQQTNFVLNQNLYPIQNVDLEIVRDGTAFTVVTQNEGDAISYAQFNLSNFEHAIVFDNITLFNDIIYNLVTGLRQNRIYLNGTKTGEWNGTVTASGFILNQDNVLEWNKDITYTKGSIVKFKNKYWTAIKVIQPSKVFNENEWKETEYGEIQKGLLPNSSTRSYESALYYNVDKANLEQDADLLSFSLIGYRPRDYLAIADLTDITQINVYKNLIKNKGTRNSLNAFKGANLPQGGIDYEVYENWAIKSGEFGGTLNSNFVEMRLSQPLLTSNPSIVSLTEGIYTPGSNQEVPLYSLFNYSRPINDPNILSTINPNAPSTLLPTAGYVNFNDVKMSAFYMPQIATGLNQRGEIVPLADVYVRDYIWIADYQGEWHVYTPESIGQVINVQGNLNAISTITFDRPHGLSKFQPFAIIGFGTAVDGYYIVEDVLNLTQVSVELTVNSTTRSLSGLGVAYKFQDQRVATPADIQNLPLLTSEFVKNTVWVDENTEGSWAVYRKSLNYQFEQEFTKISSETFGSAVAYSDILGYIFSDATLGEVYRYRLNLLNNTYQIEQTLTNDASFGTSIAHTQNIMAVSEPTSGTPKVYLYVTNDSQLNDDFIEIQQISRPFVSGEWGSNLAISGDSNWLYVSATDINKVYVYRKQSIQYNAGFFNVGETYIINELGDTDFTAIGAVQNKVGMIFVATGVGSGTGVATQITYELSNIIDGSGLAFIEDFGYSISTDYYGDTVVIGAPNTDSESISNNGTAYVYQRYVQNIEAQVASVGSNPQSFTLGWLSDNVVDSNAAATGTSNQITLTSTTGLSEDTPIIFNGVDLSGSNIIANKVYYIAQVVNSTTITIKESRNTNTVATIGASAGTFNAIPQLDPLYVSVNGILVQDNNYATYNSTLIYTGNLLAGDIINVSDNGFALIQTLTSEQAPRTGVKFGTSVSITRQSSEILVGAPFALNSVNQEGAVFRFTNGGGKYGIVIGTNEVSVTSTRNIFINGYLVTVNAGSNATDVANSINQSRITNVQAAAQNNVLIIQVINSDLTPVNERLLITATDADAIDELGLTVYTQTQIVQCPHLTGPTQFGTVVKFNENDSFVASAPRGTRYAQTTFDFTDDENLDNDTLFDNNTTQFIDSWNNAGAVYMFDYLGVYQESLTNCGAFTYAQSTNAKNQVYGAQPMFGTALDFNNSRVVIGTPGFRPDAIDGQVVTYTNATGVRDWAVYRESASVVDINKIANTQLFSAETNDTLINLDYFDPLQGKLLGVVQQNIDCISNVDPASYNIEDTTVRGLVWGSNKVGTIWLDTSGLRYVNYHQNDVLYNARYWGSLFPTSDVAVYTWVAANGPPNTYIGPGTVYDPTLYTVEGIEDASGIIIPVYYFWVRNSGITFTQQGKDLSDVVLANYIASPIFSGISYMAPLLPNAFGLYNCLPYVQASNTIFHLGYSTGSNDNPAHTEYSLIRSNYADDFLPGFPTLSRSYPESLYDRMLDSLAGVDEQGGVVPDPFLPRAVQSGVLARPRQSFFYLRLKALENYLKFANSILKQFPIAETRRPTFLFREGQFYNTTDYWSYINWWATGYDNNTKSALQVPLYSDLETLVVDTGTIVTVATNGNGLFEVYRYDGNSIWTRIGLQNGTIEFSSNLWNYSEARLGFGDNFFDTQPYDEYPSEETRWIIRALNEQIYTNELLIYRNRSLILLFEYIQSETGESQNYLPWLNKTSLADVTHTIRELKPFEVFQSDNQDFLSGYLNETKPYHVVIKDFLFEYTGEDIFEGDITDFDLPSKWNPSIQQFVTPELVYSSPRGEDQFLPDSPIWENADYTQWYQNKGVSLTGQPDYYMTTLSSYVTLASNFMVVDNAQGFPINGTIRVGTEEIGYSSVDRGLNILSGLIRGLNGTVPVDHIPGESISMDLPAVLLLDGGSQYIEPPKVTAYIDTSIYPEPAEEAELEAIMSLDSVLQVNVINPGKGYAVLPEIIIEPSIIINFASSDVNDILNTIQIYAPTLQTGNLVRYKKGTDGINIGGLIDNQWYYVNLLQTNPTSIIALYSSYSDCINDFNRIDIYAQGSGTDHTLSLGAKASAVSTAYPVRENNIKLRFDRTTYNSQVLDWRSGAFYGAFFAGAYSNTEDVASSSVLLESTQPPISSVLASAQGFVVEVSDVENDREVNWSSFVRNVYLTNTDDVIRLKPLAHTFIGVGSIGGTLLNELNITSITQGTVEIGSYIYGTNVDPDTRILSQLSGTPNGVGVYEVSIPQSVPVEETISGFETNTSGTTLGFTVNMPVQFIGSVGSSNLVDRNIYYVKEVVNKLDFKISATENGSIFGLNNFIVPISGLTCLTAQVVDTAILTVNYPGLRNTTATEATTNKITVPISPIGTGGTAGFYVNMPLFFTGNVFGNIIENQVYYVTTVCDNQTFTISQNENPETFDVQRIFDNKIFLDSSVGLSVNDPIIFNNFVLGARSITSGILCTITNPSDTDFTLIGAPDNFVGTTFISTGTGTGNGFVTTNNFGNIISGQLYYVQDLTGSINEIQISESINGEMLTLTDINDVSNPDGSSCLMTSQVDTLDLTTATGNMTMNVNLPVSPGQVNGQRFTLYNTSSWYTNITNGTISGLIEGTISAVLATVDRVIIANSTYGGATNFYVGMPIRLGTNLDILTAGTTYYVETIDVTSLIVTETSASKCYTDNIERIYVGMPVTFSGQGLGGIIVGELYVVSNISSDGSGDYFQLTDEFGNPVTLTTEYGTMILTGEPYVTLVGETGFTTTVSDTEFTQYYDITDLPAFDVGWILGGYRVIISNPGSGWAVDNVITIAGTNFNSAGGTSPANDLTLTVNSIDENGAITDVICSGVIPDTSNAYYLKVIAQDKFAVYSNPLMTVPVSGIDFNYGGFTQTTVTQLNENYLQLDDLSGFSLHDGIVFTGDVLGALVAGKTYYISSINNPSAGFITISETPGGSVFTAGNFIEDQSYVIQTLGDTDFTLIGASSNTVGTIFKATGVGTGTGTAFSIYNINAISLAPNITVTRAGSFAFAPEPLYFNQSIVKFNNRVYVCIISNNDDEFIFGKWEELTSGDRRLNALDRVIGYYQPTVNMPGVDLPQLFTGLEYPNATYYGNPFQPSEQYEFDTVLLDQPFYPTDINLTSILFDGFSYLVPSNQTNYSAIVTNRQGDSWSIGQLANVPLGLTDISYDGETYVISSRNSATPIFRSVDGISWTSNGYFTPYGSTPYDELPYDLTSIAISALSLNSVTSLQSQWFIDRPAFSRWVAVGDSIVTSDDTYVWRETFAFPNDGRTQQIYSVAAVSIPLFTGFVAVGKGENFDYSTGITITVPTNIILVSTDGILWTQINSLTTNGLYGVTSNGTQIVAVGENGVVYTSTDGFTWIGVNETNVISTNSAANILQVANTSGFSNGDTVQFNTSFDVITANTTYTIANIISTTQLELDSVTLTTSEGLSGQVLMFKVPTTPTLRDIIYADSLYIAVGNDGFITASTDAITWSVLRAGDPVDPNLNGISYVEGINNTWTAVGDNNTILQSIDGGTTWQSTSIFTVRPTTYNVKGDPFQAGYGPEELVPGVISDQLTMIVTTRPGTNWPETEYAHVGYNVVSLELEPSTSYSFYSPFIQVPAQLSVFKILNTGLSVTLYSDIDYTIDWVNQTITLNSELDLDEKLRIDIYEVGNGDQLVKSNTKVDPLRINSQTGFEEIYTNINYSSAAVYDGGGIIRPEGQPTLATATASSSLTNSLFFNNVESFLENQPITFSGTTFGGITEGTVYFVKSISYVTNSLTLSLTVEDGVAGSTFLLSDYTGPDTMVAIIQVGTGLVWSNPIILHNGTRLIYGQTSLITKVDADTDEITALTTETMVEGQRIRFGLDLFTTELSPLTDYYIKTINPNGINFTISTTLGGPDVIFNQTKTGSAVYVTNDYGIGVANDGVTAKIVMADDYNLSTDYIAYSLFGQTFPVQYNYTLPETIIALGDGSQAEWTITNYVGEDNSFNAIVEIDGVRQTISQYTIDPITNKIIFDSPPVANSVVAITTYNSTQRQYFNTQYGVTGTPGSAAVNIVVESTNHVETGYDAVISAGYFVIGQEYVIDTVGTTDFTLIGASSNTPGVIFTATGMGTGDGTAYVGYGSTVYDEDLNWLELASGYDTSVLNVNDSLVFSSPTLDDIVAGETYYVTEIWNSTQFVVSTLVGGDPTELTNDTGAMNGSTNPIIVANITFVDNEIVPPLSVNVTGCSTTGDLITLAPDSDGVSVGQTIIFKTGSTPDGSFINTCPYMITKLGTTDWNSVAGTSGVTYSVGDILTATNVGGSGTGEAAAMRFADSSGVSNIRTDGTVYYVESLSGSYDITISETSGGTVFGVGVDVSSLMVAFVGGTPAVRVTTGIPHRFTENTLVQINGVEGSVQLNNNTYYAKIINTTQFDLYFTPYKPYLTAINDPVLAVSSYVLNTGYVWRAGLFTLIKTIATATTTGVNLITVNSIDGLVVSTPIFFTETGMSTGTEIMGGIIAGEEYYIKDVEPVFEAPNLVNGHTYTIMTLGTTDFTAIGAASNSVGITFVKTGSAGVGTGTAKADNTITISTVRLGTTLPLDTDTGLVYVTQWEQTNVDRLWVTINGYRVPSSKLVINPANDLSILATIEPGDEVIITSMMPSATPNEEVYINFVGKENDAAIYRANSSTRAWATYALTDLFDTLYVSDINAITNTITQTVTASTPFGNYFSIGLTANKTDIQSITVYNNTKNQYVDPTTYFISVEALSPILKIQDTNDIDTGDSLTIVTIEGLIILVNGEQIKFSSVGYDAIKGSYVSGLQRGYNGTIRNTIIPRYSEIYGLLEENRMPDVGYNQTWSPIPGVYNITEGDPLQIANSTEANFLRVDIS